MQILPVFYLIQLQIIFNAIIFIITNIGLENNHFFWINCWELFLSILKNNASITNLMG